MGGFIAGLLALVVCDWNSERRRINFMNKYL